MRALPSGQQVTSFGLATNRVYKNREGEKQEATEFHNIVAFGRPAELIGQYMKKGRALFVEGRLQTRSWESDGQKKYRTEIVVENFQFGGGRGGGAQAQDENATSSSSKKESEEIQYPDEEINPEDIPF